MTNFNNIQEHQYKDSYYYVYELIDPRSNQPFYVGKGKNDRMYQHIEEAKRKISKTSNKLKINKIRKILNSGYKDVIYNKVIENITSDEALLYEQFIISWYRNLKINLCNLTDGGIGGDTFTFHPRKEEIRIIRKNAIKNSELHKIAANNPILKEKQRNANTNKIVSLDTRIKISIANTGQVAWNKGLTKETDERVKINGENSKKTKLKNKENNKIIISCILCGNSFEKQKNSVKKLCSGLCKGRYATKIRIEKSSTGIKNIIRNTRGV